MNSLSKVNKIFIIDDEPAVRDALTLMIEQDDFVVESFDSAEAFLAASPTDFSGCAIIDVNMSGMGGMHLHEEMQRLGLHLPIVFLTGHGNIPMSVRAIKAGAVDFLTKPVTRECLMRSLRSAIEAGEALQTKSTRLQQVQSKLCELTIREREVMKLAVLGHPNKQIARDLDISHRTVEIHKANIMHKTGAANLLDLARLANDGGMVRLMEES